MPTPLEKLIEEAKKRFDKINRLAYQDDGKFYTGRHGDTECTEDIEAIKSFLSSELNLMYDKGHNEGLIRSNKLIANWQEDLNLMREKTIGEVVDKLEDIVIETDWENDVQSGVKKITDLLAALTKEK